MGHMSSRLYGYSKFGGGSIIPAFGADLGWGMSGKRCLAAPSFFPDPLLPQAKGPHSLSVGEIASEVVPFHPVTHAGTPSLLSQTQFLLECCLCPGLRCLYVVIEKAATWFLCLNFWTRPRGLFTILICSSGSSLPCSLSSDVFALTSKIYWLLSPFLVIPLFHSSHS